MTTLTIIAAACVGVAGVLTINLGTDILIWRSPKPKSRRRFAWTLIASGSWVVLWALILVLTA